MGLDCDYTGHDFGANYPDSVCVNGFLWDMDSGYAYDGGWVFTRGGDVPCPKCNQIDIQELVNERLEENQACIDYDFFECSECGAIIFDDGFLPEPAICQCRL